MFKLKFVHTVCTFKPKFVHTVCTFKPKFVRTVCTFKAYLKYMMKNKHQQNVLLESMWKKFGILIKRTYIVIHTYKKPSVVQEEVELQG